MNLISVKLYKFKLLKKEQLATKKKDLEKLEEILFKSTSEDNNSKSIMS
jgi:hypothetical protein